MAEEQVTRKLTAILYADVAGYSRLTGQDEFGAHRPLPRGRHIFFGAGGKFTVHDLPPIQ